jgi:hypothetical protein
MEFHISYNMVIIAPQPIPVTDYIYVIPYSYNMVIIAPQPLQVACTHDYTHWVQ